MPVTINGTTGIAGANGSASTPAVQGEDTNTGVFFPAADTVAVATGGSERLRVDSSGNVGIGATPTAYGKFEVTQATNKRILTSTAAAYGGNAIVGIDDAGGEISFCIAGNPVLFATGAAERARIDSSGNLLVGTTDPGTDFVRFACAGATRNQLGLVSTDNTSGNGFVSFRRSDGTQIGSVTRNGTTNAVLYNTTSDYRLKENVTDLVDGLSRVMALRPVSWVWKDCEGQTGEGFIAHEVQAIVPSAVSGEKDAVDDNGDIKPQGMDASYLVATLVKAVQELTARITALEAAQ
jgi:hypothetical protein